MARWRVVLVLLAVLSLVPIATAQGPAPAAATFDDGWECFRAAMRTPSASCVVLYPHISNGITLAPFNTERPPTEHGPNAYSVPGHGLEALWPEGNELRWVGTAGSIEYGDDGKIRSPHAVGLAGDLTLHKDVPITGHAFLSIDSTDALEGVWSDGAGAALCLTVTMTLETFRRTAQPESTVIAAGAVTKSVVNSEEIMGAEPTPALPCPDGTSAPIEPGTVTDVAFELRPVADPQVLPKPTGFGARLEWYLWSPTGADGEERVYPSNVAIHTGPDTMNRIALPLKDAIRIESMTLLPYEGMAYLTIDALSVFGSYDVDPASVTLTLRTLEREDIPLRHVKSAIPRGFDHHGAEFTPAQFVVPWAIRAEQLDPGIYELRAHAQNLQHTAMDETALFLRIDPWGTFTTSASLAALAYEPQREPTPGPAFLHVLFLLVAGLATVSYLRRR